MAAEDPRTRGTFPRRTRTAGRFLGTTMLLSIAAAVGAAAPAPAPEPVAAPLPFTPVQPGLFAVPGSLANAWADFDGDGDPDLAVSTKDGAILLYRNDPGGFTSVGAELGLPEAGPELRGLSWGDYDADGDPDLFVGSNVSPVPGRSYLYRNDGARGFVETADAVGLTDPGRFSRQANWVDFDGDGALDLYAANRAGSNRLYVNTGGRFDRAPFAFGTIDVRRTVGACWFDFDGDGDLDLFLANQSGDSDALWRNDGDRFVDVAPRLGLDQTLREVSEGGVGCAPGDYDDDGDPDLFVGTYGRNLLYRNQGGYFVEVARALGVEAPHSVVGAAWGDYDNDGDLDLFLSAYERVEGVQQPLDHLYRNDGSRFVNVLPREHPMNAGDHGVEWVDYDGDGDVDLSLTDGYGPRGGHPVFRNDLEAGARRRGFALRVLDAQGRATRAGAEVRVLDGRGRVRGLRLVSAGGGYNAQSVVPLHLVAPPGAREVRLEVRFPGPDGGARARLGPWPVEDVAGRTFEVRGPDDP